MSAIIEIHGLRHAYKNREALRGLDLSIAAGEIFGLLGPNGSGKTTLFRILATSFAPGAGDVKVDGLDLRLRFQEIRKSIGIVFQNPSLDLRLTVRENLVCHGRLYGIRGAALRARCDEMLARLSLSDRAGELAGKLSGGLKRRVELAKGLLPRPKILILDEPSTGLDPGARRELWDYLKQIRAGDGVTVLVTTHLMEEAEACDRVAIIHEGRLVKLGKPAELKRQVGCDVLMIQARDPKPLAERINQKFRSEAAVVEDGIRLEHANGAHLVAKLVEAFPGEIDSVTYRHPTLEDVFLHETGSRFWSAGKQSAA